MAYVPPQRRGTKSQCRQDTVGGTGTATDDEQEQGEDSARNVLSMDVARQHLPKITPTVWTGAKILCYGDSLTAGYSSLSSFTPYASALSDALGGVSVDHAGMCGWTTSDMLRQADSRIDSVFGLNYPGLSHLIDQGGYSVVILMAGTNDLGSMYSPEMTVDGLKRLHQICHTAGCRTVAVSIPQSYYSSDSCRAENLSLRSKQREANSLLRTFAESCSSNQCIYVDMESKVPYSEESGDWMPDGLHFSKMGYQKFGRLLAPELQNFLSSPIAKESTGDMRS